MSGKITKQILIYINAPYRQFRIFGIMALTYVGIIGVSLTVAPSKDMIELRKRSAELQKRRLEQKRRQELESEGSFETEFIDQRPRTYIEDEEKLLLQDRLDWTKIFDPSNLTRNLKDKPYLNGGILFASFVICTACILYPRRQIHSITLLPGGERVRFTFFSPFAAGKPPKLELPLEDVSCVSGRDNGKNYSILKLKGYKMYHLVSLPPKGDFLQPRLYDKYLGYSRSWASKQ